MSWDDLPLSRASAFSTVATPSDLPSGVPEGSVRYVASNDTVYVYDGATWIANGTGTGDVVGPGSSTDNAVARFDGTTGKLIQNSTATIDDAGNLLVSRFLGVGGTTSIYPLEVTSSTNVGILVTSTGTANYSFIADRLGATPKLGQFAMDTSGNYVLRQSTSGSMFFDFIGGVNFRDSVSTVSMKISSTGNLGVGIGSGTPGARVDVSAAASGIGLIVSANATTPGNLQEWRNSSGTALSTISSAGVPSFAGLLASNATVNVAGNVTLTNKSIHFVSTAAARTLTLPAPSTNLYVVVKDSTGGALVNNITINPAAAQTIDGAASATINIAYGKTTVVSDGTNYFLL